MEAYYTLQKIEQKEGASQLCKMLANNAFENGRAGKRRARLNSDVSWTRQPVLGQNQGVKFDVVGAIEQVQAIAAGPSVKVRSFLRKTYGRGRWRKLKGVATVRLPNGSLRLVELHWYEAHGIGKRDFKIKGYLD